MIVTLLLGMQLASAHWGDATVPRPVAVVRAEWQLFANGSMWRALRQTLEVFAIGFSLAVVTGVGAGILIGGFRTLGRVMGPFVDALNSTPRVAFIPFIIVWLGLGAHAKIAVTWSSAMIPMLITTASGIDSADDDLTEMARSLGASRQDLFWRVLMPGAVPTIVSGLRIGAAMAVVGTVVAELYTAQAGLGGLLVETSNHFEMAQSFAVVVILAVLGVAVTTGLKAVENHCGHWRTDRRGVQY